ncbi:hypothetical protein A3SI_19391 [Nitritalea halalkaliphila LW7]|uniref:Uncharacterized protein n=1 Tax=Nitritalea halalkaliphila LW7 TaxID=1189621 RepID=I5BT67_9BACT|nr:transposase [Nitritalea halalkaliphila]EIM72769.1 hypothetical protein A3SI_19391 [Nitritalea halalkaliphila LW7]
MTLQEFVDKYQHVNFSTSAFLYYDAAGNQYSSIEEAYEKGVEVRILKAKDIAMQDLAAIGITSEHEANMLTKIFNGLFGQNITPTGRKRRKNFTDSDKKRILREYEKAARAGVSKFEFANRNEVSYPTLLKWVKEEEMA